MLELLSPAGSPEGVSAAVQNGADAVYASFGGVESARTSLSLSSGDFSRAAEFCRQRGVKIYALIDYLPSDTEFEGAVKTARVACRHGADALIVNDFGLVRVLRRVVPDMPLFTGDKICVHNIDGAKISAAMGIKRVSLARELTIDEIAAICKDSPVETEVTVHGSTCASYAGLCHLAEAEGTGNALHGICPAPCRAAAASSAREPFPLWLKDTCLISKLKELETAGVTAVRIAGRDRRPEYSALTTDVYSRAIKSGEPPEEEEINALRDVFSPAGVTTGWPGGESESAMLAKPKTDPGVTAQFFTAVRKAYLNREYPHVPVWFYAVASIGKPMRISAADDRGNLVEAAGPAPELAFHQNLTYSVVQTELLKTGGTPFYCDGVKCQIDKDIYLAPAEIGKMRDSLLKELLLRRKAYPPRPEYEFDSFSLFSNSSDAPALTVSVSAASQLSAELLELAPPVVYVPLWELTDHKEAVTPFLNKDGVSVAAALPRVIREPDMADVRTMLEKAKAMGVKSVLVSDFSHVLFARSMGFKVRGDFGLNMTNSRALGVGRDLGLISAALPFGMSAAEARAVSKPIDTEMIVYGRLPLMLTENCIAKSATGVCACGSFSGLADPDGLTMPTVKEYGCRNALLSSRKLFVADRLQEYMNAGLWGVRLSFTTESAPECVLITKRYLGTEKYTPITVMDAIGEQSK